ncbi:MAG: glycosyl hydrolase [Thermoleophilia bacterium]|nr:glycosyl hydrolase [Thermoleophilia bacterium]
MPSAQPQREWPLPDFEHPESIQLPSSNEFGRPLDTLLPPILRFGWAAVSGGVRKGVDLLVPEEGDTPDGAEITAPLDRAKEAQRALIDEHAFFGSEDRFHSHGAQVWRTEAWPLGQVLHGRIAIAMQDGDWERVDAIFTELESYRVGDGFVGGIGDHKRYYDDNAWIGLAAMQAYTATGDDKYLHHAERTFRMVRTGQHDDGGLYWLEQDRSGRHTCSVAPAAQLAMQLYSATHEPKYLRFGVDQATWLNENLRLESGLYGDNKNDASGNVDPTVYSYNQGTPLGLDVQLFHATGDRRYLERAQQTADAALTYYGSEDRLWKQPPVFNAVFLRNLLALHAAAPNPKYVAAVDAYLDRVWTEGRNAETGLFDQGGIGHYDQDAGSVIDQGALSQLFAIRALPPEQWATLA